MTIRKTAIATAVASLAAGLLAATPAYAIKVNDNLEVNGKVFANWVSVDGKSTSAADDAASGFHFDRAYFEVRGKLTKEDMVRITLDQKAPDGQVFVKYAYWQHKYSDAFKIKVGQNHTPLVDYIQTEMWGHRYVQKTFSDYYGAQTSSDLGVSALGKGGNSFDYYVSVMNGEGYTHTTDGAGYALMGRAEWHGAGAHIGVFGHSETDRSGITGYDPTRAEIYAWWENDAFMIGGQYLEADDGDYAKTTGTTAKFKDGTGYNVLANIKVPAMGPKTTIFARYDSMDEMDTGNDHTLTIAGIEFEAAKGVMLAVDYQSDDPGTTGSKSVDMIGVHGQFKF
ncbi:MAG: hypothetical protein LJE83_05630 [Gammaproteobacteria bacterium]|nr:hypothetical protein [Gammaproteobacteria bacterium]